MSESSHPDAQRYSREELEVVRRAVSKALEERGIKAEEVEVYESSKLNLRVEIYLKSPCGFSMNDLIHAARRVGETTLGAITHADGEEFPLDFEASADKDRLRLKLWF